jgi:hypothetical protein
MNPSTLHFDASDVSGYVLRPADLTQDSLEDYEAWEEDLCNNQRCSFEIRAPLGFCGEAPISLPEECVAQAISGVVGVDSVTHLELVAIMLALGEEITGEQAEEMLAELNA